jgi:predicted transcriptional regulator of viral defense system
MDPRSMDGKPPSPSRAHAVEELRRLGAMFRFSAALGAGVHHNTLRRLVNEGKVERVSRGLYRLCDAPWHPNEDLAVVSARAPDSIVCLISALSFHELTTQVPHEVYIAVARNQRAPRIEHPPIRCFRFSGKAFTEGVEVHSANGQTVRVYGIEKTVVDCFKFRNVVGLDVAIEALRDWERKRGRSVDKLMHYAKACRMDRVMRPYLEAIVAR